LNVKTKWGSIEEKATEPLQVGSLYDEFVVTISSREVNFWAPDKFLKRAIMRISRILTALLG
jgi:hypothetical protein